MPSIWHRSNKYKFLSHWFDSIRVQIVQSGCSTHSVIPSGSQEVQPRYGKRGPPRCRQWGKQATKLPLSTLMGLPGFKIGHLHIISLTHKLEQLRLHINLQGLKYTPYLISGSITLATTTTTTTTTKKTHHNRRIPVHLSRATSETNSKDWSRSENLF